MEIEAIVTVHDGELIRQCEGQCQFAGLSNYSYLYVGRRPLELDIFLPTGVRILHPASVEPNYEHLPHFYDFTGWYSAERHDWFRSAYVITLQYDMFVTDPNIESRCVALLEEGSGPVAFTAGHNLAGNFMLGIPGFRETYQRAMYERGVDPNAWERFNEWPSTQGTAWRVSEFENYLRWFTPFFDLWRDEPWAGHLAERTVKAWCEVRGTPARYLVGAIRHEARDCHGTGARMAGNLHLAEQRAASFGQ